MNNPNNGNNQNNDIQRLVEQVNQLLQYAQVQQKQIATLSLITFVQEQRINQLQYATDDMHKKQNDEIAALKAQFERQEQINGHQQTFNNKIYEGNLELLEILKINVPEASKKEIYARKEVNKDDQKLLFAAMKNCIGDVKDPKDLKAIKEILEQNKFNKWQIDLFLIKNGYLNKTELKKASPEESNIGSERLYTAHNSPHGSPSNPSQLSNSKPDLKDLDTVFKKQKTERDLNPSLENSSEKSSGEKVMEKNRSPSM